MEVYKDDLAYIHDVGFGDFAKNAAPELLAVLRQRGLTGGLVVDLGCGSGLWAEELTAAGYDVLGVDISPAMIEIARRRAPRARFEVGSFLVEVEEDREHERLMRRIISFRRVADAYRRDDESHRIRLYKRSDIAAALRRSGFRVRPVRGYGQHRFRTGHVGFIARKP